jgi:hypothetical protein
VGFAEIDVLGVCVAPLSLMMAASWLLVVSLRRAVCDLRWAPRVWHPPLFWSLVYVIFLSAIVLWIGR